MAMFKQQKIFYAKVLGAPQPDYNKTANEWSFELSLDKEALAEAKKLKLEKRIKNKGDEKGNYISFKRSEFKKDGKNTANEPFRVVDHRGDPWPSNKKIGNGSVVNVNFNVYPMQSGGNKPVALAIQVWKFVAPENRDAFPVDTTRPPVTAVNEVEAAEFDSAEDEAFPD